MAAGQRPRSDAGNRVSDEDAEAVLRERPATKELCCGMLIRVIQRIEQGQWAEAEVLLVTAQRYVETVTDPLGEREKVRSPRRK